MAEPSLSTASSSKGARNDMEGVGKFKLIPVIPKGGSYKAKFQALREKYDVITLNREQQRRELEQAQQRLKDIQAENDLMLDAMQIVAPLQPALLAILQSIDAELEMSRPQTYAIDDRDALPASITGGPPIAMDLDQPPYVNGHAPSTGLNGHTHVHEYETSDRNAPSLTGDMKTDPDYPPDRETNGR